MINFSVGGGEGVGGGWRVGGREFGKLATAAAAAASSSKQQAGAEVRGNGYGNEGGCSNKKRDKTQRTLSRKKVGTRGIKAIEDGDRDGLSF